MIPVIRLLLITGQHMVQAAVAPEGKRILDVLNDKTSEYLKLVDPSLAWSRDAERGLGQWQRGVLLKANLTAVVPFDTEHEAPQKRQNLMVRKARYEVVLALPDYELRGFVHLAAPLGPLEYLAQLARDGMHFFPITDATFTHEALPADPLRAPVAMVNRYRMGFLQLGDRPITDPGVARR